MHALDGARLKLDRAREHLDSLKAEIARYLDTRPYEFPVEEDGDVLTAKPAIIKAEPYPRLGCILGDCLTNLRASLDYIAWQLGLRYSPTPLVEGKDIIYFPLAKDPTGFNRKVLAKYAVPAPVLDIIESVQPYQSGFESLELLKDSGNQDKHRNPLLTIGFVNTTSIDLKVEGPPLAKCVLQAPGSPFTFFGHNVTSMGIRQMTVEDLTSPTPMPTLPDPSIIAELLKSKQPRSVKVDGKVSVFVSLQTASGSLEPVEQTLGRLHECVAGIVSRFDSAL